MRVDYKQKLKELKSQREKYYPLLDKLAQTYLSTPNKRFIIEDFDQIYTMMSLIDNEYLDNMVFRINESGNDVVSITYLGGDPLTQKGIRFINENSPERGGFYKKIILTIILIFLVSIILALFFILF